ncbi:ATP-dependent RNA helicase RhlB [Neptuniibacter sp. CAU 1671]|uniref:ATP-dependent RNA helicase RhlB n=1 Tax=Neptuniibacter sp. CAU 1671 TaxID=3032593 RepID=UPI0023DA09CC|nr:ATP-dependent RNA helicase RhlB [Neptuniibacter sp. CAU 1671]MDF2182925.1 ATP-dependent RNA helicase RhlB [Neptuniibacter sp. CAU 1671]
MDNKTTTKTSTGRRAGRSQRKSSHAPANWSLEDFQVPAVEDKLRFHDFHLPDVVMHAIADLGFEYASPIQAATIPAALAGKDIIGKAQTGTGKTAAFLLGIITDLIDYPLPERNRLGEPRALIVAPTRELALQIASDAVDLSKYTDLHIVSLVGGMDYDKQRQQLKQQPVDILVVTPGRLIDFINRKDVDLWNVEVLVLDEADRMLSMGFIPDVRTIIRNTPRKGSDRQTLLYSATFTDDILNLAAQWTFEAVKIEIESERKTTDNVAQQVYLVSSSEKYNLLRNYMDKDHAEKVIVFCNRRDQARKLAERLTRDGIKAALMSGEIPQQKRVRTLEDFRSGRIQVLVATDVAGRGIHIEGVTHVINYQLPEDADDYVHRIGRTGRAGATGTSICFACEDDSFLIPEIEAETGVKLDCIHPDPALLKPIQQVADKSAPEPVPADTSSEQVSEVSEQNDSEQRPA